MVNIFKYGLGLYTIENVSLTTLFYVIGLLVGFSNLSMFNLTIDTFICAGICVDLIFALCCLKW